MYVVLYLILRHFKDIIPSSNNRIHPNRTIIELQHIHTQMTTSSRYIQQRNDVMNQLKNTVVVVNPDDSMSLGFKN
tara:strand:+ start:1609 stop:1836 length:228 start_codon:yes stop_codon:yes gene_type:complete